jgi:hypothetical protein
LPEIAFELDPVVRASRAVWRIGALANDAFELHLASGGHERRRIFGKIVRIAQERAFGLFHQLVKEGAARPQQLLTEIRAVEPQKVEDVENDVGRTAPVESILQGIEVGLAIRIEYDRFCIDPRTVDRQRLECLL